MVEFSAEVSVYPEVEDTVEKTIGGRQPYHHKLNPLRHIPTWNCCGTKNMETEARQETTAWQQQS